MDPFTSSKMYDSSVLKTIAKLMSPMMLFVTVVSILVMLGLSFVWLPYIKDDQLSITISFWLWFIANIFILVVGFYLVYMDTRIHLKNVILNKSA